MAKEVFCFCLLVALVCLAMGRPNAANTQQDDRLSIANTKFALDLYKRQTFSASTQNLFMSPLSISVALAMTYLGARGETKSQMTRVLSFTGISEANLHRAFSHILATLNRPKQPYTLHMANRLFGDKSYTFLQAFLNVSRKHYQAELAPVDFRGDSTGAVAAVNQWVAEQTNNKITDILSPGDVDALTTLILVNAVYFKGSWLYKFNANYTEDADFHVSPGEVVNVKMMHTKDSNVTYYHGRSSKLHCQAIELPYDGRNLSMFILLPDQAATSLSELEQKLTADDLVNPRQKFHMFPQDVHLWLPRFSLDVKTGLKEVLAGMGMRDLFGEGVADLSGMDGSRNLYVSKLLHRAVLEVNEEGTEAAAATAVLVVTRASFKPQIFRADRPFIFFIHDKTTGSVLFLGRFVKPPGKIVKETLVEPRVESVEPKLHNFRNASNTNTTGIPITMKEAHVEPHEESVEQKLFMFRYAAVDTGERVCYCVFKLQAFQCLVVVLCCFWWFN